MSAKSTSFKAAAAAYTQKRDTRAFLRGSMTGYLAARAQRESEFQDWQAARKAASAAKAEAVDNLDRYLPEFVEKIEARGAKVFFARNGDRARDYIREVIQTHDAKCIVKSKSMTGEEIHLTETLEHEGYEVVESDLGEYIVQLRGERPFHIVAPAMHLRRSEIQELFAEKIGPDAGKSDDPTALTMDARRAIRQKYLEADIGISGVNFAVAETGQMVICTNEGNGRLSTSLPKVHIAIMGIEKVLPTLDDLALILPMLATAGTGQHLTGYTTMIGGPRQPGETDGPEEFHLVIMDNGRSTLLADAEQRDALHCIRCGACIYMCPIFKNVGGHTYDTTYMGPIGSVITPHLRGLQEWKHLPSSSSLCGACTETCPVHIDLHHHLLHNRRNAAASQPVWWERFAFRVYRAMASRPRLFARAGKAGRFFQKLASPLLGSAIDPAKAWTRCRTLPNPPEQSFRDWWAERDGAANDGK